jgi:hypothetical protein
MGRVGDGETDLEICNLQSEIECGRQGDSFQNLQSAIINLQLEEGETRRNKKRISTDLRRFSEIGRRNQKRAEIRNNESRRVSDFEFGRLEYLRFFLTVNCKRSTLQ